MREALRIAALVALAWCALPAGLRAADGPGQPLRDWPVEGTHLPRDVREWHAARADTAAEAVADPEMLFPEGRGALAVRIAKSPSTRAADIQLNYLAHEALGRGGAYQVLMWVKSSGPAPLEAGVILDEPPFSGLGAEPASRFEATLEWQQVRVPCTATRDLSDEEAIRAPYLGLGLVPPGTTVWVAGVTLLQLTPPPPPVPLLLGPELLQNPDFDEGLAGWTPQAAELTAEPGACRVTRRTARWGSPVQDVRAALERTGPGFVAFSADLRSLQGRGAAFAVLHLRDGAGDRWIVSDTRPLRPGAATHVWAQRLVAWSGRLEAADLSVQTTGEDQQDLLVAGCSLRALENLVRGRPMTASSAAPDHAAALAGDGSPDTSWQPTLTPAWLEVDLGRPVAFNTCVLAQQGTRLSACKIEAWQDGQWRTCFTGSDVGGLADELHFPPATGSRVRLRVTGDGGLPLLAEFALYTTEIRRQTLRLAAPAADASQRGPRTLVGAIRWDGWCGDKSPVGLGLERAMTPERYHYRLPFYAQIRGPGQVEARCTTQEVMDREIAFAREAGIDYWAFDWYPDDDGLSTARKLYLASAHRDDVKWCVVAGTGRLLIDTDLRWLVGQFRTPNYQKVLGDRPLVYLFNAQKRDVAVVKALRDATAEVGCPTPFIVVMGWGPEVASLAAASGADALGAYVNPVGGGAEFAANMAHDRRQWEALRRTGRQVVPTVTTGWDPRPFLDTPVPWYPGATPTNWVGQATPAQVGEQLRAGLDFVKSHPEATLANTALIYAWNENAEGGWIIPTVAERPGGLPLRLDAVRRVLRPDVPAGSGWGSLAP